MLSTPLQRVPLLKISLIKPSEKFRFLRGLWLIQWISLQITSSDLNGRVLILFLSIAITDKAAFVRGVKTVFRERKKKGRADPPGIGAPGSRLPWAQIHSIFSSVSIHEPISSLFWFKSIYLFTYLFILNFWLCCVFVAVWLSLVAASGGYSSLRSTGSSCVVFSGCGMRAQ